MVWKKSEKVGENKAIEKSSVKRQLEPNNVEKSLIGKLRFALNNLFTGDDLEILKNDPAHTEECDSLLKKCEDRLRYLHNKAEVQYDGPIFERIGKSSRMEEKYLIYDDIKNYLKYALPHDLTLWKTFETYLQSHDDQTEAVKAFPDYRVLTEILSYFGDDSRVCGEILMTVFKKNFKLAEALIGCRKLPKLPNNLGRGIILKLIQQSPSTIENFVRLINDMPKKFICNTDRAELLIEFAKRVEDHRMSTGKEAVDFITDKEQQINPYR